MILKCKGRLCFYTFMPHFSYLFQIGDFGLTPFCFLSKVTFCDLRDSISLEIKKRSEWVKSAVDSCKLTELSPLSNRLSINS
jgi:hypothetical protein